MVIGAIKWALENMDKKYCKLSQLDYSRIESEGLRKRLAEEKYLERPFAYEFYHQLRKLMDNGDVDFGGPIIQAEVDKRYQHCFKHGKIPDFIIHVPNTRQDLAVIEFKLAANLNKIEDDFRKLIEFRKNEDLEYTHVIEVIIGSETSLEKAKGCIRQVSKPDGEEIIIIGFNTDSWRANESRIRYKHPRNVICHHVEK